MRIKTKLEGLSEYHETAGDGLGPGTVPGDTDSSFRHGADDDLQRAFARHRWPRVSSAWFLAAYGVRDVTRDRSSKDIENLVRGYSDS